MSNKLTISMIIFIFLCTGAICCFPVKTIAGTPITSDKGSNSVTVFAAASTTDALNEIGKLFSENKMGEFTPSFASSSTLAKQIENGAPANVFISADKQWMDYLEEKKVINPATRQDLLGNQIVLIAPKDSRENSVDIHPDFDLPGLLGDGYLAMGDPDHIPAGIYGKEALESLGVWHKIKDKIARAKDVRNALAMVERRETSLGVVYATDAMITNNVHVVGIFPENTHAPIVYPVALIAGNETQAAKRFIEFLKSPEARAIFQKYGFKVY